MTSTGIDNWPAPARLTVGIVSGGRVGTALGEALESAGHVVGAVAATSKANIDRVKQRLPESEIAPVPRVVGMSELLIVSVPDDELESIVTEIAVSGELRPGTIVAHTAGAHGVEVLAPLIELGATPLALHPAMTFVGSPEDTEHLRSACFGITAADEVGYAIAQALVLEMGGEPVRVREEARSLYHAALAHGANHLVALICDAVATLRIALAGQELPGQEPIDNRPGGLPEHLLAPLVTAALRNVLELGPAALTGPVARGDAQTVAAHLEALGEADPGVAEGYRAMARRAAHYSTAPVADVIAELDES
ncbi:DUF2520 domain-containing protein [Gordonia jinhuaensis]|uniref:Oxidoreductase n=1 Tax=Gordonia jinhuaensis TaxID=1517702 RepID=A0A916TDM0_9ACTN|nr:DUF2520 domain-containing protein [Gordonia jinhuaensis]GGB39591.1 hypothetical protein GCM10011489_29090 [Gordonia jinhuaensis]